VTRVLVLIAASVGSAAGWWLGAFIGTMTAFIMSCVGMAAGVYVARRWAAQFVV